MVCALSTYLQHQNGGENFPFAFSTSYARRAYADVRLETGCQNFFSMWHLVALTLREPSTTFFSHALEAIKKLVSTSKLSTILHGVKVSSKQEVCARLTFMKKILIAQVCAACY